MTKMSQRHSFSDSEKLVFSFSQRLAASFPSSVSGSSKAVLVLAVAKERDPPFPAFRVAVCCVGYHYSPFVRHDKFSRHEPTDAMRSQTAKLPQD